MRRMVLAIISAAMLILAFPPFSLGFLAWGGYVPFLFALDSVGRKRGFLTGFIFGAVFFLGTIYWVIHSMYYYGGIPFAAGALVMLALALFLSLYFGFFALLFASAHGMHRTLGLVMVPAMWVALEWLRGHLFTGLPWVLTGYTQAHYLPLIQLSDVTGVWGVSYVVLVVNVALFLIIKFLLKKDTAFPAKESLVAAALVAFAAAYGFIRISLTDRDTAGWQRLTVGVTQGSIDQSIKWDESYQETTLGIYKDLSLKAAKSGARVIIWPETAIPFYFELEKIKTGSVGTILKETNGFILTGSPSYKYNLRTGAVEYYNSAYLLSPAGEPVGKYDKVHLVPYGEYVPLKRLFPFIKKLTWGIGDFQSGPGPYPINFEGGSIGTLICFESIFPELAAGQIRNGAQMLVNLTNDAWFGFTSAPYQHFEMSILRAVENKSYLLRSANTGISAVIDPAGRVLKRTALFEKDVIVDNVGLRPAGSGALTLYSRFGDVFAYGCLVVLGAFIIAIFKRRKS